MCKSGLSDIDIPRADTAERRSEVHMDNIDILDTKTSHANARRNSP